jgi:protein gp37
LWAGTSITNKRSTIRIPSLLQVGDSETIRFLSVEPQIEPIDLRLWLHGLNWVIQGGESGNASRPFDLAWITDVLGQCRAAGVPLFVKQLGSYVLSSGHRMSFEDDHAGNWTEWPDEIRLREMPRLASVVRCSHP